MCSATALKCMLQQNTRVNIDITACFASNYRMWTRLDVTSCCCIPETGCGNGTLNYPTVHSNSMTAILLLSTLCYYIHVSGWRITARNYPTVYSNSMTVILLLSTLCYYIHVSGWRITARNYPTVYSNSMTAILLLSTLCFMFQDGELQ